MSPLRPPAYHGKGTAIHMPPDELAAAIATVLSDPGEARSSLPRFLAALDTDDAERRVAGAWALCFAGVADDATATYVASRLWSRLGDDESDDADPAVRAALWVLGEHRPDAVESVLPDDAIRRLGIADRGDEADETEVGDGRLGRSEASDGTAGTDSGDGSGAGDAAAAGGGGGGGRGRIRPEHRGPTPEPLPATAHTRVTHRTTTPSERADADGPGRVTKASAWADREFVGSLLSADGSFSEFEVVTYVGDVPYGEAWHVRGRRDGDPVVGTLFVPELPRAAREGAGAEAFASAMADWERIDDHDHVRSVLAWADAPRPWALLDPAGEHLVERSGFAAEEAVETAIALTEAVSYAHEHGVVHGAVRPRDVGYGQTIAADRDRLQLAHFGFRELVAAHTDRRRLSQHLAPEHVSDEFGGVDGATDVYCLGTTTYTLLTGRRPYADRSGSPPRLLVEADLEPPTAVDPDLLAVADRIVATATATRKLERYDRVAVLKRDLQRLRGALGGDDE